MKPLLAGLLAAVSALAMLAEPARAQTPGTPLDCPARPSPAAGRDFSGQTLTYANFAGQDLTNASFKGATLKGVVFIRANLTGADFSGATIVDTGAGPRSTDFSFANLESACFIGAKFDGRTHLTYAKLPCADFSNTDLTATTPASGRAVLFGDQGLAIDTPRSCRARFRKTTMSCEFVAQWKGLDMTQAVVTACQSQLETQVNGSGPDFSGGIFNAVDFSGMALANTRWAGAKLRSAVFQNAILDNATGLDGDSQTDLSGANFNRASLKNVSFAKALAYGAIFSNAELSAANFSGANLTNNTQDPLGPIDNAATFDGAHLKYVNFSGASLNSVSFQSASVYGSMDGAPDANPNGLSTCETDLSKCSATPITGATCSCATMSNANLTRTDFTGAFLYGVDFSGSNTKVNGSIFSQAILVAANFASADFQIDTASGGGVSKFDNTWLQGTNLAGADLRNVSLSGAFLDFGVRDPQTGLRTSGRLALLLPKAYTQFPGWAGQPTPCVHVEWDSTSKVPTDIPTMKCPNAQFYAAGCGPMVERGASGGTPVNPAWYSQPVASASPVAGWYIRQGTYEQSAPAQCNGLPLEPKW